MTSTWSSFHVHLHGGPEQMDAVLREHVGPYAARLLRDGRVGSWHYERSWQGGPHLRWRLAGADPDTLRRIRADLAAKVAALPPPPRELLPGHWYARFGRPGGTGEFGWHRHGAVVETPYPGAGPDGAAATGGPARVGPDGAAATGGPAGVGPDGAAATGGPAAGVGAAERLAAESSRVALAVLKLPARRRMAACLDLLFAVVAAARLDDADAVALLRGYANGRALTPEAAAADLSAALDAAEAEFQDDPDRVRQRRLVVAASVEPGEVARTTVAAWADAVAEYVDALRTEADDAARTPPGHDPPTTPLPSTLAAQIHLLHNRIGLGAAAGSQVAWLASFAYLPGTGPTGFHDAGLDGADRIYHERAKYVRSRWTAQSPRHDRHRPAGIPTTPPAAIPSPPGGVPATPPGAGPATPPGGTDGTAADDAPPAGSPTPAAPVALAGPADRDVVRLPAVAAGALAEVSLADALRGRRSHRRFAATPLAGEDVSRLLHYAAGDTTPGSGDRARLAYPAAGGRSATSLVVWPRRVDGIGPALYAYRPAGHALHRAAPAPTDGRLRRIAPQLALRPRLAVPPDVGAEVAIDVDAVPLWLFVTSDLGELRTRFGQRAYRYAAMEAGHLAQNLLLAATAMGLSSVPVGGFFDDDLNQLLLLDGVHTTAFYALPVAHPTPRSA
ncbi:lantibiotic dehydratase C-terminal domain-containing protein [Polymorphospora rubra]|uniref:lantibiotic dehydratase C-terminal domain-containing protein n=1 Tax=Polymorphospora rubra TaxID=338584 RepID=UPI003400601E